MSRIYTVTGEKLESWLKDLDCFTVEDVIKDIKEILASPGLPSSLEDVQPKVGLTFDEIEVGKTYRFRADPHTKKSLHLKEVEITGKKLKNVQGVLKKTGIRYTIPPSALERV